MGRVLRTGLHLGPTTHTPYQAEPSAGQALTSSFWMESGDRLMCCTYFLMSPTI